MKTTKTTKKTLSKREQRLVNARRALLALAPYALGESAVIILGEPHREMVGDLLDCFMAFDRAARKHAKTTQTNTKGNPS